MPTCLHGWGSDGMSPSGCPECAAIGRERDREELARLRDENVRMHAALKMIDQWDMLNPPSPHLADAGWLRRVVDDGLGK